MLFSLLCIQKKKSFQYSPIQILEFNPLSYTKTLMIIKCSICLELFTESSEIMTTPCGHTFHSYCLERSIQAKHNCPQCRKSCTASIRGPIQLYLDSDGTGSAQSEDKFFKLLQNAAEKGALARYKMVLEDEDNKNPGNKDGKTSLCFNERSLDSSQIHNEKY